MFVLHREIIFDVKHYRFQLVSVSVASFPSVAQNVECVAHIINLWMETAQKSSSTAPFSTIQANEQNNAFFC